MQTGKVLTAILFLGLLTMAAHKDLAERKIPNRLTAFLAAVGLLSFFFFPEVTLWERVTGVFCVSIPMAFIAWQRPKAFGGGDIKLMAAVGLFLGWKRCILAFTAGMMAGAFWGFCKVLRKKADWRSRIALGPCLALGVMAVLALDWLPQ